ncbi:MAG: hypothetical protein JW809_17540 [Pirellulales bacterium]|nr:hypothetical protein [Pirellulales bacterium]
MTSFFRAMLVGNTGPVPSRDDWPDPLKSLVDEPNGVTIAPSTIQVHCLCQGWDPEFVWRMDATPGLFEHLKDRWKLTRISNPNWPVLKGRSRLSGVETPPWWSPRDDDDTTFFACPQTLAGEKDNRFQVALDKKQNTIFVHYWFNF